MEMAGRRGRGWVAGGPSRSGDTSSTVATSFDERPRAVWTNLIQVEQFHLYGRRDDAPEEIARYRRFVATFPADVVICHCWQEWSTDLIVEQLRATPAAGFLSATVCSPFLDGPAAGFSVGFGAWMRRHCLCV